MTSLRVFAAGAILLYPTLCLAQNEQPSSPSLTEKCGPVTGRIYQDLTWTKKLKYGAAYFTNGAALEATSFAVKKEFPLTNSSADWEGVWADLSAGKAKLAMAPAAKDGEYLQLSISDWQRTLTCVQSTKEGNLAEFGGLDLSGSDALRRTVLGLQPDAKGRLFLVVPSTGRTTDGFSTLISWEPSVFNPAGVVGEKR